MTYSSFGIAGVRNAFEGLAAGSPRVTAVVVSKATAVTTVAICIAAAFTDAPLRTNTCRQGEDVNSTQRRLRGDLSQSKTTAREAGGGDDGAAEKAIEWGPDFHQG